MLVPHTETNPYQPPSRADHTRLSSIRNLAVAVAFGIVLIGVLMPFGYVSAFDGHFNLTIVVRSNDSFDTSSLLYAPCWTNQEAQSALAHGTQGNVSFYPSTGVTAEGLVLSVPCSGRSNAFGRVTSYNHPQYVVIQYSLRGRTTESIRKQLSIPPGRGDRSVEVYIP